jgi:flagellar hook-length control protein FliK
MSGGNIPSPAHSVAVAAKSPADQASALFKSLPLELEKFQQTNKSQIQIELPVGDNESVKIRLSIRAGEIRSTFITESPELRDALQKSWPDFAQNIRERGFRMGDPAFQQAFQNNNPELSQDRGNQSQRESEEFIPLPRRKAPAPASANSVNSATSHSASQRPAALWA